MLAVPWDQKMRPGETRVLQRRALKGIVPDVILRRRGKARFTQFWAKGFANNWDKMVPWTKGKRLGDLGIVEPRRFEEGCQPLSYGRTEKDSLGYFLSALSMEAWLDWA